MSIYRNGGKIPSLLEKVIKLHCNMCMILGSEVQITSFRVSKLGMHLFCHWYKKIVICTKRERNNKRRVSSFVREAVDTALSLIILFLEL